MGNFLKGVGSSLVTSVISGGLSGLWDRVWNGSPDQQAERQFNWNRKMMEEQAKLNRDQYDYEFAKESAYNDPKAQRERMEKAGLNPALMYGQGATQQGVNASITGSGMSSISAPRTNSHVEMSPELALVKSQAELNRAKAEEARASARRSSGEENRAEKLFPQEAELLGLTVENQKTQNLINSLNAELFADTYSFKVSEAAAKLEQIYKQNELTDAEIADYQSAIAYRAVQSELARKDIELKDAQIVDTLAHAKLNKQMIQESFAKIGLINAQEMAEWSRKYNLDYASEKLASENELLKKDIDTYDSRYWNKIITSYARSGSDVLEAIVDLIRVFKKNGGEEDQFNNAMSEVASEVDWSQMWQVATTMVE